MAVTVVSRPDDFSSAYNPVEYTLRSSLVGSATIGSSTNSNGSAGFYTSGLGSLTGLQGGNVVITNTTGGEYDGEFIITSVGNNGLIVVDTPFTITVTGGNIEISRPNLSIVCDLYVDGSFLTRKTRFPNIDNQFVFDFSKELQPSLGVNMKPEPLGDASDINEEASASIYIKYAELYDLIQFTSITPTYILDESQSPPDLFDDSGNSKTVVNSIVPHVEWKLGSVRGELINTDSDLDSFLVKHPGAPLARFLTNSPKTIRIGESDSYQLSCIIDYDPTLSYRRNVTSYDSTGAVISTHGTSLNSLITGDSVLNVTCGTRDLPYAALPSGTVKYDVVIVDISSGAQDITETITFEIDTNCYRTQTRFVWLSPRGGYDAYTFNSPRKLNSSVNKGTYNKTRSNPVVIDDREESITSVLAKDTITTGTDKVTREVAEWLQELLESPQVFIELKEGNALHETRIPVTLINKTRSISDSYNGLFNVRLRYKFAFSKPILRAY